MTSADYPPLPPHSDLGDCGATCYGYTADQMRAYCDADRASRAPAEGWQPIETAPKDGMRIMLGIAGVTTYPAADLYLLGTWDGICSHPYVPNTWTHWMPLPPAPTTPEPRP